MEEETEEIQRHITAAYHSVDLVNRLISGEDENYSDNAVETVERNIGHLKIMMGKNWFVEGLTEEQKIEIEECISEGEEFIKE